MSHGEYCTGRTYSLEGKLSEFNGDNLRNLSRLSYFQSHGCNNANDKKVEEPSNIYSLMVRDFPISFRKISNGQKIKTNKYNWKIMISLGHFPKHINLYNDIENMLISSDMILPKITSHIGVFPNEPNGNTLDAFLKSLVEFKTLPRNVREYPPRIESFEVIIKRITPLEIHHLKRIKKTLSYCMYGKTVYELIANIFSKNLGPHQFFFVLSELVAHLNHGWHKKMLSRFRHRGIIKFKTVN